MKLRTTVLQCAAAKFAPDEAHLATKGDAQRVGMLRHDELSHVSQSEVWSDRMLPPLRRLAHLHTQAARLQTALLQTNAAPCEGKAL